MYYDLCGLPAAGLPCCRKTKQTEQLICDCLWSVLTPTGTNSPTDGRFLWEGNKKNNTLKWLFRITCEHLKVSLRCVVFVFTFSYIWGHTDSFGQFVLLTNTPQSKKCCNRATKAEKKKFFKYLKNILTHVILFLACPLMTFDHMYKSLLQ